MVWPLEAFLLILALVGCWAAASGIQAGLIYHSWPLGLCGAAIVVSLASEIGTLNGDFGGSVGAGVGTLTVIFAGAAVAALAVYLLLPPPERVPAVSAHLTGPAADPDSEA